MVQFICLFFPAVISVWIYEALSKKDTCLKHSVYRYSFNAVLINFLVFAIEKFFVSSDTKLLTSGFKAKLPDSALLFLIIAVALAVALGLIEFMLSKNTTVSVSQNKTEEEPEANDESQD